MSEELISKRYHQQGRPFHKKQRFAPPSDLSHHVIRQQNPKVPRLVSATLLSKTEFVPMIRTKKRWASLRRVQEHPGSTVLFFDTLRVIDLASAIDRACRLLPSLFTPKDYVFVRQLPLGCFLQSTPGALRDMRCFLLGDFLSDPTAKRRYYYSPHLLHWYQNGTDIQRYSVVRTLLKWTCVTRSRGKKLALPHQPCFALYRHLHKMVACFPPREQSCGSTGSFFHALRSFLQLEQAHYISPTCLNAVKEVLREHKDLQAVFPQVTALTHLVNPI